MGQPPLDPSQLNAKIDEVMWQLRILSKIPQTQAIFKQPSRMPPISVIETLTPSDVRKMNEQQIVRSLLQSISTTSSLRTTTKLLDRQIQNYTSTTDGLEVRKKKYELDSAITSQRLANATNTYAIYSASSLATSQRIQNLESLSTRLFNFDVRNRSLYKSTQDAIFMADSLLASAEATRIRNNPDYVLSQVMLSSAVKMYTLNANALSMIQKEIPALETRTVMARRAAVEATRIRGAAESTLSTTTSSILGYTTLSTMFGQEAVSQRTQSMIAESQMDSSRIYANLADFCITSNQLSDEITRLQTEQNAAKGLSQAGGALGTSIGKAAVEMANLTYTQIGGQLSEKQDQYISTVTGIEVYEAAAFGLVTQKIDQQINFAFNEMEGYRNEKEKAIADSIQYQTLITQKTQQLESFRRIIQEEDTKIEKAKEDIELTIATVQPLNDIVTESRSVYLNIVEEMKKVSSQYDSYSSELAGYELAFTTNGRLAETLETDLATKRTEYETLLQSFTDAEINFSDLQMEYQDSVKEQAIKTRFQRVSTNDLERKQRMLNLYEPIERFETYSIFESDLRSARNALSDEISKRMNQLKLAAQGSTGGPDLTDETYVTMKEQLTALNRVLDEDYPAFYPIGEEYKSRLTAYESLLDLFLLSDRNYVNLQIQQDQNPNDHIVKAALQTTFKQYESLQNSEINERQELLKLKEQLIEFMDVLDKNIDLFVPEEIQQSTRQLIESTMPSNLSDTAPPPPSDTPLPDSEDAFS